MGGRVGLVVVLVALLCGLVGCRSDGDPPAGSVSPGPVVSVSSSTPASSGVSEEAALYAEAERVFRAAMAAQRSYAVEGDYSEFPPELADYYGPEYLELVRQAFDQSAVDGLHSLEGEADVQVSPHPTVSKGDSEATLQTCVDARHLKIVNAQGQVVADGQLGVGVYYLKRYDGVLKIFDADVQVGETCPLG